MFMLDRSKGYAFMAVLAMLCLMMEPGVSQGEGERQTMPEKKRETIRLPDPAEKSSTSVEAALFMRRSVRSYQDTPLGVPEISQLLWAAQGITDPRGLRTAPSAGALYPLEIYLVAGNVDDLPDGVYKYRPARHELTALAEGDKRNELCNAALGQTSVKNAAAVIVISAEYERTTGKYGDRGRQYVHMEAGHAAQNVFLQSVPLNIGTVVIGAFYDEAVKKVLEMPGHEQPLYIMPVGRMK